MSAGLKLHRLLLPVEGRLRRWLAEPARDLLLRRRGSAGGHTGVTEGVVAGRRRHRLLVVLHRAPGGTLGTTFDLLAGLDPAFEPYLLLGDLFTLRLFRFRGSTGPFSERGGAEPLELLESFRPQAPWSNQRRRDPWYADVYRRVLGRWGIDVVHVRHLLGHTLDLFPVAAEAGVPVVLSLHDYYVACPGYQLLDDQGRFCAGRCTPGDGQCHLAIRWLWDLPRMKGTFVEQWRHEVGEALAGVAVAVTTSHSARDALVRLVPELAAVDFRVVEHGRDLERRGDVAAPPVPGGTVRIAFPGRLVPHKGSGLIRRLALLDQRQAGRLEMHFLGPTDSALRGLGVHHGAYRREEMAERLAPIRPHFAGLLSVTAETYSHTLTEAWALGVPALVSDRGALRERVERHGGGWVLPVDDPVEAYRRILAAADDGEDYRLRVAEARRVPLRRVAEMAADYAAIYRHSLDARRG